MRAGVLAGAAFVAGGAAGLVVGAVAARRCAAVGDGLLPASLGNPIASPAPPAPPEDLPEALARLDARLARIEERLGAAAPAAPSRTGIPESRPPAPAVPRGDPDAARLAAVLSELSKRVEAMDKRMDELLKERMPPWQLFGASQIDQPLPSSILREIHKYYRSELEGRIATWTERASRIRRGIDQVSLEEKESRAAEAIREADRYRSVLAALDRTATWVELVSWCKTVRSSRQTRN